MAKGLSLLICFDYPLDLGVLLLLPAPLNLVGDAVRVVIAPLPLPLKV